MAQPFVGEIRMFGGNFAPQGWAFCDGQLVPISENETLFNLIGTTYGGDGQSTFALPDLRSRVPVHQGQGSGLSNHVVGEAFGTESVTLTTAQMPTHSHVPVATSSGGTSTSPTGATWASWPDTQFADAGAALTPMAPNAMGTAGNGQPIDNIPPVTVITFIISLFGIYPSPT
jgi:microcystin-dependent protein